MAVTQIEKEVRSFLTKLGSGPNKIAESLAGMKIKGTVGDGNECPVAKAIRKNFKNLKEVCVAEDVGFSYKKEAYTVGYPAAIGKFIEKFDNGDYPTVATKSSLAEVV
jgi:hypothetical protein